MKRGGWKLFGFEEGVSLGILIGEGHFGGDGRQPQVTVRRHTRHGRLILLLYGLALEEIDGHVLERFQAMKEKSGL